ncbi:MAG TPA: hypothetical protein VFG86_22620 [Chloroflexota bacterium]|jgi:hypothetical protein|nr:hypothetical protein [Chloroflexota bacterium]
MASWYRDAVDMRTRVCVSNLEVPEAPQLCQPVTVLIELFDSDGAELAHKRFALKRNASLVLETRDLLPDHKRSHVLGGQVRVDFEGPQLGSSRAYLHWYNERGLTSSHEKFGLTIPAVAGYWTVPNVQDSDEYRVHLAIANLDEQPYTSTITLKDAEGEARETTVGLPRNGSRFVSLADLFDDAAAFLKGRPGVLYFGNNHQPAMYYYFVQNQRLGTWRAQHL